MIQPSLLSAKASTGTLTEKLAAFFRAHPSQWIDGMQLAAVAGSYAWRSRCSDVRVKFGMVIENRQRRVYGHRAWCPQWDFSTSECECGGATVVKSEYRYVPAAEA